VRRILIIGPGGAGKSALARELGRRLGLEVFHLDKLHWRPVPAGPPKAEWLRTLEELAARDSWIMDSSYSGSLEQRLARCDTVVFLDMPRCSVYGDSPVGDSPTAGPRRGPTWPPAARSA
jgi:adenylate kinase family enzyme